MDYSSSVYHSQVEDPDRDMDTGRNIPHWKTPLSKSFSTNYFNDRHLVSPVVEEDTGRKSEPERTEPDPDSVIQILLPCIICNRTFSPEALERHSKVCTKVNVLERQPSRPQYDSHAVRIKNTRVADFIPPPHNNLTTLGSFSRSNSFRRSFQNRPESRVQRSASIPKTLTYHDPDNFGNSSDFGSSEDSGENGHSSALPSYARALSPAEDCPYCLRSFGLKAYDRHVTFCRELWERRQFERQPTPNEIQEARERQEVRTKYRPIKGSNSLTSLRSMSPGKDVVHNFATTALNKLFSSGLKSGNYGFKKSNDSLTTSCYGDFARSRSFRMPSSSPGCNKPPSKIPTAMRLNTNFNLPAKTKSTERLNTSSGYGPGGHYMENFSRNSKLRGSLGRNFFRNGKRSEPEGLENTAAPQSPLIITPMNFYPKMMKCPNEPTKPLLMTSDPKYDPYEKAAKQLDELLKSQPQHPVRANTQRKVGLDRALASVMTLGQDQSEKPQMRRSYNQMYSFLREDDPFVNVSADEGYWEEILKGKAKKDQENIIKSEICSQRAADQKRDSSDSSMDNFKYRVSNVSSADSAFSRSDGTDLEFEALENLLNTGNNLGTGPSRIGSSTQQLQQRLPGIIHHSKNSQDPSTTSFDITGIRPSHQSNYRQIHPTSPPSSQYLNEPQIVPTYAKFCHQCGMSYPTSVAKFCSECGERRVMNV